MLSSASNARTSCDGSLAAFSEGAVRNEIDACLQKTFAKKTNTAKNEF